MPPPPLAIFFGQHTYRKNVYRDEGVILSHICWGPDSPLPLSRPQTPPPPPDPAPPPALELAGKWEGVGIWPVATPPPCPIPDAHVHTWDVFHLRRHTQHSTCTHTHTHARARNAAQHNTTQHSATQHNTTQHNTTRHNTTQHNATQHNTTQHNTTQHNTTQHNTTQHSTAQHNTLSTPQRYPWAGCRVRSPGRQGPGTANGQCTNSVGCVHALVPSTIPRDPAAPSTGRLGPGNGQRPLLRTADLASPSSPPQHARPHTGPSVEPRHAPPCAPASAAPARAPLPPPSHPNMHPRPTGGEANGMKAPNGGASPAPPRPGVCTKGRGKGCQGGAGQG